MDNNNNNLLQLQLPNTPVHNVNYVASHFDLTKTPEGRQHCFPILHIRKQIGTGYFTSVTCVQLGEPGVKPGFSGVKSMFFPLCHI